MSPLYHKLLAALSLVVVSASESAELREQFPMLATVMSFLAVAFALGTKLSVVLPSLVALLRPKASTPPGDGAEQVTPEQASEK